MTSVSRPNRIASNTGLACPGRWMITSCGWDRALRTQWLSTSATIGPRRRSNFRSGSQQEGTLWSPVSLAAEPSTEGRPCLAEVLDGHRSVERTDVLRAIRTRESFLAASTSASITTPPDAGDMKRNRQLLLRRSTLVRVMVAVHKPSLTYEFQTPIAIVAAPAINQARFSRLICRLPGVGGNELT